jgi:hypothetical protein
MQVSSGLGGGIAGQIRAAVHPAIWAPTQYSAAPSLGPRASGQGRSSATLIGAQPNKRLKLTARVDCGMNLSSARRSLSAIR